MSKALNGDQLTTKPAKLGARAAGPQQRRLAKPERREPVTKQRFGLPVDFVPRLQRYGRSVLLELNVYRLPNGQEFIPCHPSGTLGKKHHLYALITNEQHRKGQRGSVYIRHDGRIFDYSSDAPSESGDLFDTGYTIYDLERTGQYAPELVRKRKPGRTAAAPSGNRK